MSASSSLTPPVPVALSTSAHEWRYLSEGKLNIVFTHNAAHSARQAQSSPRSSSQPPNPPLIGRVLKINKNVLRSALEAGATAVSLSARLHFARDYVRCVMHPLFAHAVKTISSIADDSPASAINPTDAWMAAGTIVWLDSAMVAKLINSCRSLRPLHRVAAFSAFDSTVSHSALIPVFLFEDYTSPLHLHLRRNAISGPQKTPSSLPPTVTLELKPKWGYMPSRASAASIPADRAIKFSTCRYCMHQHLKLQLGEVAELSGFCPLDLFSCSPPRVSRALSQLIRTPQNNMRLFVRTGAPSSVGEGEDAEAASEPSRSAGHRQGRRGDGAAASRCRRC